MTYSTITFARTFFIVLGMTFMVNSIAASWVLEKRRPDLENFHPEDLVPMRGPSKESGDWFAKNFSNGHLKEFTGLLRHRANILQSALLAHVITGEGDVAAFRTEYAEITTEFLVLSSKLQGMEDACNSFLGMGRPIAGFMDETKAIAEVMAGTSDRILSLRDHLTKAGILS